MPAAAQPAPAPRPAARVLELDTLRAAAILAVMAYHEVTFPLVRPLTRQGWAGVDLFFVLSGYLITGILLRMKPRPGYFRRFYGRRCFRIFPPYYGFLLLAFAATLLRPGWRQPAGVWLQYLFYLPSVTALWTNLAAHMPAALWMSLIVCWSLSVEEFFYLLWAPAVKFLDRRGLWRLVLAVILAAPLVRLWVHRPGHPEYFFFPARMDALAWGALVALALPGVTSARGPRWALLAAAAATLAVFGLTGGNLDNRLFVVFGYSLLAALFALLLANVLLLPPRHWLRRAMRNPVTVWIGMTSYTTYLIHRPVQLLVEHLADPAAHALLYRAAVLAVSLAAAFALSGLSWYLVEQPVLRLKDRLLAPAP
jgi:peptidoglycan/LPS O-acetylase OafA/YrhL